MGASKGRADSEQRSASRPVSCSAQPAVSGHRARPGHGEIPYIRPDGCRRHGVGKARAAHTDVREHSSKKEKY